MTAPLRKVVARATFLKSCSMSSRNGVVSVSKKYAVRLRLECGHKLDVPMSKNLDTSKRCKACVAVAA